MIATRALLPLAGLAFALGPGAGSAAAQPAAETPRADRTQVEVRVCDGDEDWPPFSFRQPAGDGPGSRIGGFTPALLAEVLEGSRYRAVIGKDASWARCLEAVRAGDLEMALQAAFSEERAREYLLSEPIYTLEASYFYSREAFPDGLAISDVSDLNGVRVCGVFGYDYTYPGLDHGRIDQSAQDYATLVRLLHRGRCQVFVESATVLRALSERGGGWLDDPRIAWRPVPGLAGDTYHFLVSRGFPEAELLVRTLDAGLGRLEASGRLAALRQEHLDAGSAGD